MGFKGEHATKVCALFERCTVYFRGDERARDNVRIDKRGGGGLEHSKEVQDVQEEVQ